MIARIHSFSDKRWQHAANDIVALIDTDAVPWIVARFLSEIAHLRFRFWFWLSNTIADLRWPRG